MEAALSVRALRCWLTAYRRTWRSSVWTSVFGPAFYLSAMGLGLGTLVNSRGTAGLGGVSYLAFVAPAILAASGMNTAMGEATWPVFGSVKWNKIYIAALATPLRPGSIFRGHLAFITMRITMNAAFVTLLTWAFGAVRSPWVALAWPAAVLTGLAFAAPIAAWAVTVKTDYPFNYLYRFGMVPLMLFSGTYFPLSQLPGWLRPLAYATPLWHGVDLCRMLSLGHPAWPAALGHLGYLSAVAAAGIWAGAITYRRRLYV
jgi:lipooligosaccharide transport system permease protein